jgi:5-methylcytosine-specific restriction endonuclease McrA
MAMKRPQKSAMTEEEKARSRAAFHREIAERQKGYRERALRLFPHVCASCGREFSGKRLKELTVHHKDHNHNNNPPDGSNWELLCIYCHDHEHEKSLDAAHRSGPADDDPVSPSIFNPFAGLDGLVKPDTDQP